MVHEFHADTLRGRQICGTLGEGTPGPRKLVVFAVPERFRRESLFDVRTHSPPFQIVALPRASLPVPGTRTSSLFIPTHPTACASLRATDISRATTPARLGARRARVSRSATCAAERLIRENRKPSWYQRRPDRTQRTWLADRAAGYIADSVASAGSVSATVGPSHPVQSRRCSAPAQRLQRCGPPMSAACTIRTIVEKVGVASSAMRGRRSIYAVSPCCSSADQTQRRRPLDVGLQRGNGAKADI
jgi:hypothetical protein